ncbi:MAG: site-2 protease family protein [Proteobacteria bacterium]|nr:site-2 protease family protein [Pseudomonadota bacterium]MBU0966529.1 site-2 protease family protein [Pseudomonadota bacterium]MBU4261584.1 site-2 protease family protein [Pseudomonadota bacterium]MBU4295724.1 site-2 protease family protein [Pseudomonadota bacterium]MCG2747215.1 site-2 protease family protein [Desulfobulbaceae bacterium]
MNIIQQIIILAPPFLFALTIHEYSHGLVAYRLGDPTASNLGRLTLNPLKHLDPLGVLAFIIMKIGWAKPVPVNPRYFKNPLKDMIWVALAGPAANLMTAIASSLVAELLSLFAAFIPKAILFPLFQMVGASIWINIVLAVFNLLPIPPLDGSKVLMGILPPRQAATFARLEPFGFLILLALFYTGFLQKVLMPIIGLAERMITG